MRLLFVSNEYPPETGYGGIGTYTKHIAEVFASKGHFVYVICRSESNREYLQEINGVRVHRIPVGPYPLPIHKCFYLFRLFCYKTIPQALIRLAWAKSTWLAFQKLETSEPFDIIEFPECGAEGYYFKQNLPCVTRLHTPWSMARKLNKIHESFLDVIFQEYLECRSTKKSILISSPTKALSKIIKKRWGLKHITAYPNPIPKQDYEKKSQRKNWIYTGRIEHRKGLHVLIEAYARLTQELNNVPHLFLIGRPFGILPDGRDYGLVIKRLIDELGISEKITWIQGVPQNQVISYLKNSSVAFFPSLWENFPYSCLEAMASGIAVCASDCGGYPEMIDDQQNGLLFKTGDVSSLVSQMIKLMNSRDLVAKLGENARLKVETCFDSKIIYQRALDFYQTIQRSNS